MKRLIILCGFALLSGFLLSSCTKDEEEPVPPTVAFNQLPIYITGDVSAAFGDTLKFGIILQSNGTDNLVKFEIKANGQSLLDSTINTQSFTYNFYTIKGISDQDIWAFKATDIAGNKKEETITITGTFGQINTYTTILVGAQDNAATESFLSFSNNQATKYFQAQAFQNQDKIDIFCFFENTPEHQNMMSLGSPGSNITGVFTGATSPDNYTTKNLTRFYKTTLNAAQFDAIQNDAIILDAYNATEARKKASVLTAGEVYAIKIQSGLTGLIKVIAVNGAESGTLEIAVKIQKQ
ncbi:MAG: hypothetical protein K0B15_01615 [Lentimicrobium sp.]|nr:hypothetical protein [Lentimicrobium sp.]